LDNLGYSIHAPKAPSFHLEASPSQGMPSKYNTNAIASDATHLTLIINPKNTNVKSREGNIYK
jgi:hypothetical protein